MDRTKDLLREQTRARYPDGQGYVEREGVRIFYEEQFAFSLHQRRAAFWPRL